MSSLKRNFLVSVTALSMIFMPYMAMAADWTPPTGSPPGNNTEAPINVSSNAQTKSGGLFLTKQGGNALAVPYGDIKFGTFDSSIGVNAASNIDIYGKLIYRPSGTGSVLPSQTSVLSPASNGVAVWKDINSLVNFPTGTVQGQTLYWDAPSKSWKISDRVKIQPNGINDPVFTVEGKATIEDLTISHGLHVNLDNSQVAPGKVLTATDSNGSVGWAYPSTSASSTSSSTSSGLPATAIQGQTLWYNNGAWEATNDIKEQVDYGQHSILIGALNPGSTHIYSPTVILGGTGNNGGGQTTQILSDSLQLKGNTTSNSTLNPDTGRFLYSKDINGTASWNPYLVYEQQSYDINPPNPPSMFNTIHLLDTNLNDNNTTLFKNDGYTELDGPTVANSQVAVNDDLTVTGHTIIGDYLNVGGDTNLNLGGGQTTVDGQLYLNSVPTPLSANNLKTLCINSISHLITRCDPIGEATNPGSVPGFAHDGSQTFYPPTNGQQFIFDFDGPITLKWCGGGGGGGGGGLGGSTLGGGGGGGGSKSSCQTANLEANDGDVLTWNLGYGGNGGSGGQFHYSPLSPVAVQNGGSNGSYGESSYVYMNGVQVGQLAQGGLGGFTGESVYLMGQGNDAASGGLTGNPTTAGGSDAWYYNGQDGYIGGNNSCPGCGGIGGGGESSYNTNIPAGANSHSGGGGISTHGSRNGGNGRPGDPSFGGGGGGGSFTEAEYTPYTGDSAGGNGGNGGYGYLTITGISSAPAGQVVFDQPTSGTDINPANVFPSSLAGHTVHVEMWGAGGGGGGVSLYNNLTQFSSGTSYHGGGAGSGGYRSMDITLPNCIGDGNNPCSNIHIVVGSGGHVGNSSGNSVGSNGTNGGVTNIYWSALASPNPLGSTPSVGGGTAGGVGTTTFNPNTVQNGTVGVGGNATTGTPGNSGNAATGAGGAGLSGGYGVGGNGATATNTQGTVGQPTFGTNGGNGRIKFSW